jgi:adenylyltransferase/sulfurtransferase
MFVLTESVIIPTKKIAPNVGAVVTFEGLVRNHNDGKEVSSLEYQAYSQMAQKIGNQIIEKAKNLYSVIDVNCIHRIGHLQIGEIAVLVMATGVHRKEAFLACEYVINEIKNLVPIWKREHYVHEAPEWVACHHCLQEHE